MWDNDEKLLKRESGLLVPVAVVVVAGKRGETFVSFSPYSAFQPLENFPTSESHICNSEYNAAISCQPSGSA